MADCVIVGAGTAGCVLAGRLVGTQISRCACSRQAARTPQRSFTSRRCSPSRQVEPQLGPVQRGGARARRTAAVSRGRVIGGCGSINAMIYLRGHRADFDGWAEQGCTGWSYDEVLPYFKRSEDNERGADSSTGSGGRSRCPTAAPCPRSSRPSWKPRSRPGTRYIEDLNVDKPEGVSRFQLTQRNGMRCSSADAFLHPVADRPNLEVPDARLRRAPRLRGRPSRRRRPRPQRRPRDRASRARDHRLCRHLPVARTADALRDRPGPGSRVLRDPGSRGPAGRREPAGPLHGQPQLPHRPAGPLRDLHARELRAPRGRGARASDVELPRGGRILHDALGPAGAGRRVPLRGGAVLRPGPHAAPRQRLRVRAGRHQADVARQGRPAHTDARVEADGEVQLPHHSRGSRERARRREDRTRDRLATSAPEAHPRAAERSRLRLGEGHPRLGRAREPDRLPPDLDLRHGRGRRRGAARLRRRGAPRRRRIRDADDHAREHERRDADDR